MKFWILFFSTVTLWQAVSASYNLVRDYSGSDFFAGWDYYGYYDNTTDGDVNFLDQADAASQELTYVNGAGNAIIKVDNTSDVVYPNKRNSIKITSQDTYGIGSLFIIDAVHMPYGCSVWPSFWTHGAAWPSDGEIDIIEAVNLMPSNQMSLHTSSGCTQANASSQSGTTLQGDCSTAQGCAVTETKPNSYGAAFAQAGGGVFAAQFDISGIFIWFWSRPNIPASITQSTSTSPTMDISSWGTPSASYPASSCNVAQYFQAQSLVLDITLCGLWAGDVYNQTCSGPGGVNACYDNNVLGPGSPEYDDAYFEIPFVRVYSVNTPNATSSGSGPSPTASSSAADSSPTSSAPPSVLFPQLAAFAALLYSITLVLIL